ncbi:MAG: hypothetical protein GC191_16850 [Azospirillum sp.]|nr:hypothetical protein [Azospirillum sp.]
MANQQPRRDAGAILPDSSAGLIVGYAFAPGKSGRLLSWAECQAPVPAGSNEFRWIHLNLAMQPARRWVTGGAGLPGAAVEAMLDPDPHYHVVSTPGGFLLTLNDVVLDQANQPQDTTGLIVIWVDRSMMITVRRWPMQCTDRFRRTVDGDFVPSSCADLFLGLFDQIVEDSRKQVVRLRAAIDQAEDDMLAERTRGLRPHLSSLRRRAVAMHRRIVPEYHAISRLANRLPGWVGDDEQSGLRQVIDEVGALVSDITAAQERTRVLQDEYAAKIAEETNRNLYVLSIVSVIMLPMTFVTGFFGMNTTALPFTSPSGWGSWAASGLIVTVGLGTVILLRRTLWRGRGDR